MPTIRPLHSASMRLIATTQLTFVLAACLSSHVLAAPPKAKLFYVATSGNDQWSGTLPSANNDSSDGPFASLEAARDAVRKLSSAGGLPQGGVVIQIGGGTYERQRTFELKAIDSGSQTAPIIYRAAAGEEVRLVGGKQITGFRPVTDPAVLQRLDKAARDKVLQVDLKALGVADYGQVSGGGLELFFQDRPMTLSRWPNEGFVKISGLVGGNPVNIRGTKGDKIGKFMYEGDRPKRWKSENDVWVHGYWFWDWSDQRHKVETIDTEKRIISVLPPYHHYGYRKGQWFYALNLLAELDRPGEWYLDRTSGRLYFWPPAPLDNARVTVSVLNTQVSMRDVSHVSFRGLIFEAARDAGVVIRGGEADRIAGCTLRNLGGWAVQISGGRRHGVAGCEISAVGGGGISLSGGDRKKLIAAGHFAENNHIHHYGRIKRMYQAAIALGGVGQRASNNLIHSAPHIGISFGGNDHLIELNEIHHVCQESNDAGAMYAGRDWTMRGTVIRHNFLHHINGLDGRGCVGVYLDDMFSGTKIQGNVFYKVTRAAFIGGGRDCTVENNIFVDCTPALHIDARAMGWASYHVATTMKQRLEAMPTKTLPWSERYPKLLGLWKDEPTAPTGNLVARNVSFGGRWDGVNGQARPYVTFQDNLIDHDPGFVDAAKMNFQLREDSVVYQQVPGFKKIPFEQIGPRRSVLTPIGPVIDDSVSPGSHR